MSNAEHAACEHPAFAEFVQTIARLRAPDGCPWDREQTHLSIAPNMVEEAYEAVDAIEASDVAHLREELGEVLLQVVLQSQIAKDAGEFTIDEVCADINAKMVRRHPHVFGDAAAGSANDVITLWDKIKLAEKEEAPSQDGPERLLDGVPTGLPALTQAQKISRKAAAAGFEWESVSDVWDKVREEEAELAQAYGACPKDDAGKVLHDDPLAAAVEEELGDVLFSLVNVARKMGINAENALRSTCAKFRMRWERMEDEAFANGERLEDMTQSEQEALWQAAKRSS